MDPVEKAIRNALEKGNAEDRSFREKVYRSAFAALDRATQSQPQLTVEMAIKRRQNLQTKITSIESEYLPAAPALPVQPGEVPDILLDAGELAQAPASDAPEIDTGDGQEPVPDVDMHGDTDAVAAAPDVVMEGPVADLPAAPVTAAVAPDRDERRAKRRRGPFAAMFVIVTLLCAGVLGGWVANDMGLLKLPSMTAAPPAPPQLSEVEEFDPAEEPAPGQPGDLGSAQELRSWIRVFSPDDPSTVNAPTGASAEVSEDESGKFIRIRSGSDGADVVFDLGQGVLEQIVGKKAVFDISARGADGQQTQISVNCDFGELGDCGRKRYAIGYERGEYLFDVELSGNRPGAGGSIAINSDFANDGKAVDIYEIRVSVVE
ncbi:MAG: hypothetical protein NTV73_01410 [Hyphomicrobiales bacterium]|nr:hypothetical protein [Hyphomicrobiales bacterium]